MLQSFLLSPYTERRSDGDFRLPVDDGRLRVELALGGNRVDDGSETTLPAKLEAFQPLIKEILDADGHLYVSGLKGMLKPCEAALNGFVDTKALKKAKRYHAEVY